MCNAEDYDAEDYDGNGLHSEDDLIIWYNTKDGEHITTISEFSLEDFMKADYIFVGC